MLWIAHRAGPVEHPEQTIQSALHALRSGADMAEMDVRLCREKEIVISHDPTLERIFGVPEQVKDVPLAKFLTLRHSRHPAYGAHTLEHVLLSGVRSLLLHCKYSGEPLAQLCRVLEKHHALQDTVLGLRSVEDVRIVRAAAPQLRLLAFMPRKEQLEDFLHADVDFIRLWEDWVTQEDVDRIHAAGKQVWIMAGPHDEPGYPSEDALRTWLHMGVDGILVNNVPWARQATGV